MKAPAGCSGEEKEVEEDCCRCLFTAASAPIQLRAGPVGAEVEEEWETMVVAWPLPLKT